MLSIRQDDLSGTQTRELLALHLSGMHRHSPPGSVFALDLSGLQATNVTVWTAWIEERIAGVGALKMLDHGRAEVKSMRTHPEFLRMGVAAAILEQIVRTARDQGVNVLSLETGSGPAFEPALALYRRWSFTEGKAFADYEQSAFNRFLHRKL